MSGTIHELKPCPFCGGSGEIHPSCIGGFTYEAYVSCVECGCKSPSSHYEHKAFMPEHIVKAVENWNTRPELAEARAEIENKQYTITCASEENQQLKESLAEARAEIERLKAPAMIADMREKMAALCHDQWAGWMEYLFLKSKQVDGCVIIPAWAVDRWRRQVATRYSDLPEDEKNSDRNEADRFLSLFNAEISSRDKLIEQMRDALEKWVSCPKVPLKDAISASKAALEAWRLNSGKNS